MSVQSSLGSGSGLVLGEIRRFVLHDAPSPRRSIVLNTVIGRTPSDCSSLSPRMLDAVVASRRASSALPRGSGSLRRVRHGVAAIAIGLHLQQVRPLARAAMRHGDLGRRHASPPRPCRPPASPGMPQARAVRPLQRHRLGRGAVHARCPSHICCSRSRRCTGSDHQFGEVVALVHLPLIGSPRRRSR
jgi:hypothetical protein